MTITSDNKIITPPFRLAFPKLFQPEKFGGEGDETYGLEAIFSNDIDLSDLKKLASKVKKDKWGDNPPKKLKSPFLDGNDTEYESHQNCIYMRFRTTIKPGIVNLNLQYIDSETDIYPGCWCRASIFCFAYDRPESKGITFLLNNVQKIKDDEPFVSRATAEEDFDDEMSKKSETQKEFEEQENVKFNEEWNEEW